MESATQPLIQELVSMINSISSKHWSRLRLAVTPEEALMIKAYIKENNPEQKVFYYALRGVPILIEEHPTSPGYIVEDMNL